MRMLLAGLMNIIVLSVLLQLLGTEEMQKKFIPLIKLAVGLWIAYFLLRMT